jgi:chromosome segregation ATPase
VSSGRIGELELLVQRLRQQFDREQSPKNDLVHEFEKIWQHLKESTSKMSHVQNELEGLENKSLSLQQRIEELNKEMIPLRKMQADYQEMRQQCQANKELANELKVSSGRIGEFLNSPAFFRASSKPW